MMTLLNRRRKNGPEELSDREKAVVALIAKGGLTTRQIAARLGISWYAAVKRREIAMAKKNLHNVGEVRDFALRHGLVS